MGSKLYQNDLAEKEADDIGMKFMNSSNVLGDMSKTYGVDLQSKVRFHNDANSYARTKRVNRDAIAEGNDVFFGEGVLEHKSPVTNALVAHEVAHTMQQSGEGGMSFSSPVGASQGGLFSGLWKKIKGAGKAVGTFFKDIFTGNSSQETGSAPQKPAQNLLYTGESNAFEANLGKSFTDQNSYYPMSPKGSMDKSDAEGRHSTFNSIMRGFLGPVMGLGKLVAAGITRPFSKKTSMGFLKGAGSDFSGFLPVQMAKSVYHGIGYLHNRRKAGNEELGAIERRRYAGNAVSHLTGIGLFGHGMSKNGSLAKSAYEKSGTDFDMMGGMDEFGDTEDDYDEDEMPIENTTSESSEQSEEEAEENLSLLSDNDELNTGFILGSHRPKKRKKGA